MLQDAQIFAVLKTCEQTPNGLWLRESEWRALRRRKRKQLVQLMPPFQSLRISWDFPLAAKPITVNLLFASSHYFALIDLHHCCLIPTKRASKLTTDEKCWASFYFAFSPFLERFIRVVRRKNLPSYEHRVEYDTERPHVSSLARISRVCAENFRWDVSGTASFVLKRVFGGIVQHHSVLQWLEFDLSSTEFEWKKKKKCC